MSSNAHPVRTHRTRTPAERHLRLAWVFVALTPLAFVGAMFLGEGLLSAAGYDVDDTVPFSVVLKAAGPALLLLVAPTVGAIWYGLRAPARASPRASSRPWSVPSSRSGRSGATSAATSSGCSAERRRARGGHKVLPAGALRH